MGRNALMAGTVCRIGLAYHGVAKGRIHHGCLGIVGGIEKLS